jgi:hypothetical protein
MEEMTGDSRQNKFGITCNSDDEWYIMGHEVTKKLTKYLQDNNKNTVLHDSEVRSMVF